MAKILVVDDSETLRGQLKKALESKGHQVIEAENGKLGHQAYEAHQDLKLVLSDVNMPELDGIGMLKLIEKTKGDRKVPVIMLTTESSEELKSAGKSLGVRAWVVKPFVADKLLLAVEKLIAAA